MNARIEAAAKAWDHYWGERYGDEALEEMGEEVQVALAAADTVMFSDEAIERAADEVTGYQIGSGYYSLTIGSEDAVEIVRAVVAALKGDA